MRPFLRLRFQDDGDGTGKLMACAEAGGFSGEGSAYFSVQDIEQFAAAISVFPLPDKRPAIAGGFFKKVGNGELEQEHLGITVSPVDLQRGYLGVQVRIATEIWEGQRPESQRTTRVELVTTCEPLMRFGRDLVAVVRGGAEEAVLEGDNFE